MSAPIKPKHQRLVLVLVAMATLIGAALLAAWGVRGQASFFYLPAEMAANPPDPQRAVRLGGMVEAGSIRRGADGVSVQFVITDGTVRIPVSYTGITPDLFKEGSGAVAEGKRRADGVFVASNLLAKHDEKYVPREMKDMTASQARKSVEVTR